MKLIRWILPVFLPLVACHTLSSNPMVAISTSQGIMMAEIYVDKAPISAGAFMRNVDAGIYNHERAHFYRVVRMGNQPRNKVKIEVVQGGVNRDTGDLSVPLIPHETTAATKLSHHDGSLSLAREKPGTANSEFSICIGPQPELDFGGRRNPDGQGFAVFGQVVQGMEVARRIQKLHDTDQYLDDPVPIVSIQRCSWKAGSLKPR